MLKVMKFVVDDLQAKCKGDQKFRRQLGLFWNKPEFKVFRAIASMETGQDIEDFYSDEGYNYVNKVERDGKWIDEITKINFLKTDDKEKNRKLFSVHDYAADIRDMMEMNPVNTSIIPMLWTVINLRSQKGLGDGELPVCKLWERKDFFGQQDGLEIIKGAYEAGLSTTNKKHDRVRYRFRREQNASIRKKVYEICEHNEKVVCHICGLPGVGTENLILFSPAHKPLICLKVEIFG